MISVIIPTYNYGRFIGDAIDCIIRQTYTDWELIIIDDGSTDNTVEIVARYVATDNRILYIKQKNSGPSVARNNGIRKSKGDWIQFLDPDDLIEKRKFEEEINLIEKHPEYDILYGNLRYFTKDPFDLNDRMFSFWGTDKEWIPQFSGPAHSFIEKGLKGNFSHLSSMLFSRRIVNKVGWFDEVNNAVSDYTFIIFCMIYNAHFFYHEGQETLSLVRWHSSNMSKNLYLMLQQENNARVSLRPFLHFNKNVFLINEQIIKSNQLKIEKSWKKIFLSGGPFDFLKKIIRSLGLEGFFLRVLHK